MSAVHGYFMQNDAPQLEWYGIYLILDRILFIYKIRS